MQNRCTPFLRFYPCLRTLLPAFHTSEQTALAPLPGQARKLRIASLLLLSKRDPLRWARVLLFGTMVCILSDQQSHVAADAISFAAPLQTANAALVCSFVFGNRRSKASFAPAFFAEMPFAPLLLLSKSPPPALGLDNENGVAACPHCFSHWDKR